MAFSLCLWRKIQFSGSVGVPTGPLRFQGPLGCPLGALSRWNELHQDPLGPPTGFRNGYWASPPAGGLALPERFRRRRNRSVKSGPAGRDVNASLRNKQGQAKQAKVCLGYA